MYIMFNKETVKNTECIKFELAATLRIKFKFEAFRTVKLVQQIVVNLKLTGSPVFDTP